MDTIRKRIIIFDFDGVLADSFRSCFMANQISMRKMGHDLTESEYVSWFGGNVHQSRKKIFKTDEKYAEFKTHLQKDLRDNYKSNIFPVWHQYLPIASRVAKLAIVSSLDEEVLDYSVRDLKVYFEKVLGSSSDKVSDLKKVIDALGGSVEDAVFITDTVGDISAGKAVGVKTIAVGWGFQPLPELRQAEPDYIFEKPERFTEYLNTFK